MRKLKWRLVASANVLYGQLSDKNRATIPTTNFNGDPLPVIRSIENTPYIELDTALKTL